ncbi:MAG: PA14 domain-containing protein [Verrucomicrobiales bacterium]
MSKNKLWQILVSALSLVLLTLTANSQETYSQNFDDFDNGETDLGDGTVITGAAASIQDGRLQLTIDGQGLGFSSFSIPPIEGSSQGFTITFDYEMFDSVGANDPADGFSINYGDAELGAQGAAEEGMNANDATENISFEVDTWRNGDAEQGVNISGLSGGSDLGQLAFTNGVILDDGQTVSGTMEISYDPSLGASFKTTGLNTDADFENVEIPDFIPSDDHTFIISARVGGANQDLFIDNLVISTGPGGDDDDDGLPNSYEIANDLDPDDATGDNGAEGDPDGDGLSNLDEYENKTNPQNADTDGDGLADGVENGTGDYDGPEATGTDPRNPDSDGDTLLDGVENPSLAYDPNNPEEQPGTDPNLFDTDGDGVGDGSEIASGRNPTEEDEVDDSSYVQNFDGFADGTVDLQDGTVIAGQAAEIVDGRLQLTKDGQGLGFSSFSVPPIPGSSSGFRITFDYELNDSPGANNPADGFSINYGDAILGELGQAEEGMAGGQATENISFEVDTWQNFDAEQGVNISGVAGGIDLAQLAHNNGPILNDGERVEGKITILWQPDVGASFTTTGMNTNADFENIEIPDFIPSDDHTFIISARVGGANQDFFIDNLVIETGIFDGDEDEDNLPDFYENDQRGNLTDLNGLGDGPGPGAGTGDFDGDGVTDFDEYENKTNPSEVDTDGDGLADGVENNSGDYDGPEATGTDPLNPDTDNDGLLDGLENNSGTYVSAENPGTDPHNPDTDGDEILDGVEINNRTNPLDAEDAPILWTVRNAQSVSPLNSIQNTRDLFEDENNRLDETTTIHTVINFRDNATGPFGNPEPFPLFGEQDVNQDDFAIMATGTIFITEPGTYTFGFNSDDGGGIFIDDEPVIVFDANRGSATSLGAVDLAWGEHTVEFLFWERGGGAQCQLFVHKEIGDFSGDPFSAGDYKLLETSTAPDSDSDNDGLPDVWEEQFFDNLDQTAQGDPDSDGLNNAEEFEAGTKPDNADSDDDGYADGVETGTGTWVSAENTGTSPTKSDSDGDGLADGVENPDLGYDAENPEKQSGSDPNEMDSDGDTVPDGREIALGRDPSTPQAAPRGYVQDFDGYPDGTTDLGDGSVIIGAAAEVVDGRLQLTKDGQGLGFSSWTIPAIANSSQGFTVTFDLEITDGPGANDPADGMSFNYGDFRLGEQGQAEEGMFNRPGVDNNLSFEIDTWRNGDAEQGVNIAEQVEGTKEDVAFTNGPILQDGGSVSGPVTITYNPNTGASFTTEGLDTNADFEDVELLSFVGDDAFNFGISARVGGANQDLFIDNFVLSLGTLGAPFQITEITKNGTEVEITWASRPNRIYKVERSESLENNSVDSNRDGDIGFWEEVDDGILSEGEETTFADEIFDDSKKVFWRVTDMGPAE